MPVPGHYMRRTWRANDLSVLSYFPQVSGPTQIAHLRQDPLLLPCHEARWPVRVPVYRVRQHGREQRRLAAREARGGLVIEAARGRFDAVDPAPELRDV